LLGGLEEKDTKTFGISASGSGSGDVLESPFSRTRAATGSRFQFGLFPKFSTTVEKTVEIPGF
jgi:hypothetical protein